ncbi:MAG: M20/M25/M40 family metallo-hydrolase [Acidobacteria bacterium]|nr:M20/M25/M40 family metallo-hydrolase [Acidobacteriota bacterium]
MATRLLILLCLTMSGPASRTVAQEPKSDPVKARAFQVIEAHKEKLAKINDAIFSYSEPAYEEVHTVKLLVDRYRKAGFRVETGVAGIPTAFVGVWGSGKPVIALMAEYDGQLASSQKPAVVHYDPIVEGAPGHGEGHNANPVVVYGAALALKTVLEEFKLPGTITVVGGPAEEALGSRGFMVKAGVWNDVDVGMDTHIGRNAKVLYGPTNYATLSVVFTFHGEAVEFPYLRRNSLRGVELMNAGISQSRERLSPSARLNYVIIDGGYLPTFVPSQASVWYYVRDKSVDALLELYEEVKKIAQAAAAMSGTRLEAKIRAGSWPIHQNKALTELTHKNIVAVGLPRFSEEDHAFFRAFQKTFRAKPVGVNYEIIQTLHRAQSTSYSDAGDVTWVIPSTRLHFPGQFFIVGEEYDGDPVRNHQWTQAVTPATPVAHEGIVFGAKVMAATFIDILRDPEHLKRIRADFEEQRKGHTWKSLIPDGVQPQLDLNKAVMQKYRPLLEKFYYNPDSPISYLEMLGIKYPPEEKPETRNLKPETQDKAHR